MSGWWTFCKERFPLPVYLLLSGGIASSAGYLASDTLAWGGFLVSGFGLMLFFAQLRLMDELKDYHKDLVAHPDRPLPRGVMTVEQARRGIGALAIAMIGFSALSALWDLRAGGVYLFTAGYLWLMYKEFYLGAALSKRPFLYATTHQIVLLPLTIFALACYGEVGLLWGCVVLGGFFNYEICRKLNLEADPILETYPVRCGIGATAVAALLALVLAAASAYHQGWLDFLAPVQLAVAGGVLLWAVRPSTYKIAETLATLSLLIHLWAATIARFL